MDLGGFPVSHGFYFLWCVWNDTRKVSTSSFICTPNFRGGFRGGGGGGGRPEYNRLSKHIMNLGFDIKVIHYF